MGCDIHMYVEMFDEQKQKWLLAHGLRPDPYDPNEFEVPYPERFVDRNYILFGILTNGNVRREGYGFFDPKGFPDDASKFVKKKFKSWSNDAHTSSWLTFQEIEDRLINTKLKVIIEGMMDKKQLVKLKKVISKKNYTQEEFDKHLYSYCSATTCKNAIPFEIKVPVKFKIYQFLDYIERSKSYKFSSNLNQLRIVFWFDN